MSWPCPRAAKSKNGPSGTATLANSAKLLLAVKLYDQLFVDVLIDVLTLWQSSDSDR